MKKQISLLLILSMLLSLLAGCAGTEAEAAVPETTAAPETAAASEAAQELSETVPAPDWINSNIMGNVDKNTEVALKDDFAAAVNKDWILNADLGSRSRVDAFAEITEDVNDKISNLLDHQTLDTHDAKQVYTVYNAAMDIEARNALGIQPLIDELHKIDAIENMEQLTSFIVEDEYCLAYLSTDVAPDFMDSTKNMLYIYATPLSCGDSDEYEEMTEYGKFVKENQDELYRILLTRAGYSEEEAQKRIDGSFKLESMLAPACMSLAESNSPDVLSKIYNVVTVEDMMALAPNYPMDLLMKELTDDGINQFILTEPQWLEKLGEVYVEENLEELKAWLSCYAVGVMSSFLDDETREIMLDYTRIMTGNPDYNVTLEEEALGICRGTLGMPLAKMYVEEYVDPSTKENVTEIIREVVDVYRGRLENNDWLSEETRKRAVEKLDSLTIRAAYPDDWSKYDCPDLNLPENAGLLECITILGEMEVDKMIRSLKEPVDKTLWGMEPYVVNAYYSASDNSINIPVAILGGDFYDPQGSRASQLGGIGWIIGHEITHAFDSTGSQFDKDGNMVNWWTDEDRKQFELRTQAVADYYSGIELLPGQMVDGQMTIGESVADLGGLSCMLEIAKSEEDFDYEEFFLTTAKIWKCYTSEESSRNTYRVDSHPAAYLRCNVNVQQFQEFYDTFGIQEGDGMYLAPENRLSVW